MDAEKLEELRRLEAAATPGPWGVETDQETGEFGSILGPRYVTGVIGGDWRDWVVRFDDDYGTDQGANAALIVAMRNALPELLGEIEELRRKYKKESYTRSVLWNDVQSLEQRVAELEAELAEGDAESARSRKIAEGLIDDADR